MDGPTLASLDTARLSVWVYTTNARELEEALEWPETTPRARRMIATELRELALEASDA